MSHAYLLLSNNSSPNINGAAEQAINLLTKVVDVKMRVPCKKAVISYLGIYWVKQIHIWIHVLMIVIKLHCVVLLIVRLFG